ncbi:MAG: hypothetical protein EOP09_00815 [Proteobacteria bacterium]|nr:MAG: hypothetical protein EOP09_00815 [Pseudomonadota bacterium]
MNVTFKNAFHIVLSFSFPLFLSTNARAQEDELPSESSSYPSSSSSSNSPNAKATSKAKDDGELPAPILPKAKEYSAAEIKKTCAKYEGKYILYYERIFKVEKCKRREYLVEEGMEPKLRGSKVLTVESETVAQLAQGEPLNGPAKRKTLTCSQLNGQYLLSRGEDIYFVEKCKKRLFPDFDTYTDHSKQRGKRNQDVLEMDESELGKIAEGEPIVSSLDAEYKKLLDADKGIDVLDIREACKGLNGKFVAYYSKIYRIEKCRKQPVDPQLFGKRYPRYEPTELNSDQWISIPTGTDFKL